ncbi:MAG: sensor histidine kinase [Lachnospiraceae bacterium]|jgi:two-component system sensor histidine kinase YesM|nr:sensor histidine kinase [Lachnospiraceae bacterium]
MKKLYSKLFERFAFVSIIVVLITDIVFLTYFTSTSKKNAQTVLDTAVNYSSSVLKNLNEEANRINILIQKDSGVQEALRNIPVDNNGMYSQRLEINGYLHTLQANSTVYIDAFYLLLDDGRQFKSTNFPLLYDSTEEIPAYLNLRSMEDENWISTYPKSLVANNYKDGYVAVTYPLRNIRTGECVGIVLEEIRIETIENVVLAACYLDQVNVEIHDGSGDMLLSMGSNIESGDDIVKSAARMENGWSLIFTCDTWSLIGDTIKLSLLLGGFLSLAMIFFSVYQSRKIANSISVPIGQLLSAMENESSFRQRDTVSVETSIYEVNHLFMNYNRMIRHLQELFAELERKQQDVRKSEYAALQAQINPHFLYNTLDNITWKIRSGDAADAIDEVMSLSRFFRLSLSKGAELVSVEDELEHVQLYLKIQKKRYGKRFDYMIESYMRAADMNRFYVPKLILQPLAENSIYHGFERTLQGGKIEIWADRKDDRIVFEVFDNGGGMEAEKLKAINEDLKNPEKIRNLDYKNGYGIFNINARIKIIFGMEYGLEFASVEGQSTVARLTLPCNEETVFALDKSQYFLYNIE